MTLQTILSQGGTIGWLITGCSVAGLGIIAERLLALHRARISAQDFHKGLFNVLQRGNIEEAISICEDTPGPVACITRAAILSYDEPPEIMRRAVQEAGIAEIPRMERNLNMLLGLATMTPLLGLMGTVLGLIDALQALQLKSPLVQSGDLAGGVRLALVTGLFGAVMMIPLFGFHAVLVGKVQRLILEMERAAADVMHFLLDLQEKPRGEKHETAGSPA